ncbi:hypothetical protein NECAME_18794, partial [Necator americanus]
MDFVTIYHLYVSQSQLSSSLLLEDASRSQDHVPAVAQVAPLRPEPESMQTVPPPVALAPAVQMSSQVDGVTTSTSYSEPVDSSTQLQMNDDEQTQEDDPDVSVAVGVPSESNTQSSERTQEPLVATPEPRTAESVLSP